MGRRLGFQFRLAVRSYTVPVIKVPFHSCGPPFHIYFDPITSTARHRTRFEAKFALLREAHDVIELGLNSRNSADRLRIVELPVSAKTALLLRVGSVRTRQHPVSVSDGADTSERQVLCFSAENTVLVNVGLFRLTVTLESKCSIPTSIYHTSFFPTTTNDAVLRVSR